MAVWAIAGSILAGCAVEAGRYWPARWRGAGCWAVGHTDSQRCSSATGRLLPRRGGRVGCTVASDRRIGVGVVGCLPPAGDLHVSCAKFVTTRDYAPRPRYRLVVEQELTIDAEQRGWGREVERHQRIADRIRCLLVEFAEPDVVS
jgi:hypothetical protein